MPQHYYGGTPYGVQPQDPSLLSGGPQDQVNGPQPTGGSPMPQNINAPQGQLAPDLEATQPGFGNPGGQAAADPYAAPSGPVYDQFNRSPQEGTSAGQNFQAQGQFGAAMGIPGGDMGGGDMNAAPTPSEAQIPPQAPPQDAPSGAPPGQQRWKGGGGLYGGLWNALNQQQRGQYKTLQQQSPELQPMAGGGGQSNVGRRQAMWSVLNQDNQYSNSPQNWGNFGGGNWSGYDPQSGQF